MLRHAEKVLFLTKNLNVTGFHFFLFSAVVFSLRLACRGIFLFSTNVSNIYYVQACVQIMKQKTQEIVARGLHNSMFCI